MTEQFELLLFWLNNLGEIKMNWKFFALYVITMPVLLLVFMIVALSAPQLGLFNISSLLWGAVASFVVAVPVTWVIAKKVL